MKSVIQILLLGLARPQSFYPIDWTKVQGVVPESRNYPANTDIGRCICDLTSNTCDYNCYCDPDCTTMEISRFVEEDKKEEGGEQENKYRCTRPDLVKYNKRGGISERIFENLLCVEIDNNPSKGGFFDSPPEVTQMYLNSMRSKVDFSFKPDQKPLPATGDDSFYKAGDRVGMAYVAADKSLYQAGQGFYSIPTQFASCSEQNFATYGTPVETSCVFRLPSLFDACEAGSVLTLDRFHLSRRIAKTRQSVLSDPSQWASIKIVSFRYARSPLVVPLTVPDLPPGTMRNASDFPLELDENSTAASSGRPTPARVDVNFDTAGPTGAPSVPSSSPTAGNGTEGDEERMRPAWNSTELPPIMFNEDTCECENAVVAVEVVFQNELIGQIEEVIVRVVLDSVAGGDSCGRGGLDVTQSYKSEFNLTDANPLNPAIPKSGNPGYQKDLAVLAGNSFYIDNPDPATVAERPFLQAVRQDLVGLTVMPTDPIGNCLVPTYAGQGQLVRFGQNLRMGCLNHLTFAELKAFCYKPDALQSMLNLTISHVGRWGNSDYNNIDDWVPVTFEANNIRPSWEQGSGKCRNFVNTINIELFTKKRGAETNPQTEIIAAVVSYDRTTWTFPSPNRDATAAFPMSAAVTFVEHAPELVTEFVPDGPPIFPKFPRDILYPLYIDNGN